MYSVSVNVSFFRDRGGKGVRATPLGFHGNRPLVKFYEPTKLARGDEKLCAGVANPRLTAPAMELP